MSDPADRRAEGLAAMPEPLNRQALKEWAAIDRALSSGGTVLLVRKGGIYEQRHGFQVEHREFWLFPTRFHQAVDELHPAFEWTLGVAAQPPGRDRVRIATYAVITDAFRVEDLAALDALTGVHPLAAPTVHARFHYKRRPYLHVLVVRAFGLPEPHVVPLTEAYEGCVSWVELDEALPTRGARPVLDEAEFERRRQEVLARLAGPAVLRV